MVLEPTDQIVLSLRHPELRTMYDWAEFRHFRYLLAVLEKQEFRAAAEHLYTTQPDLSIQQMVPFKRSPISLASLWQLPNPVY